MNKPPLSSTPNRKGIKIVDDNVNKRVSDIFNRRQYEVYEKSQNNLRNKERIIEITEYMMDEKQRSISPFQKGRHNPDFVPFQIKTTYDYFNNKESDKSESKRVGNFKKVKVFFKQ